MKMVLVNMGDQLAVIRFNEGPVALNRVIENMGVQS